MTDTPPDGREAALRVLTFSAAACAKQRDDLRDKLDRIRAAAESDADLATLPALRDFLLRESEEGWPHVPGFPQADATLANDLLIELDEDLATPPSVTPLLEALLDEASRDDHVLVAAVAKLAWTASRHDEQVQLTPNQAKALLEERENLQEEVAQYRKERWRD